MCTMCTMCWCTQLWPAAQCGCGCVPMGRWCRALTVALAAALQFRFTAAYTCNVHGIATWFDVSMTSCRCLHGGGGTHLGRDTLLTITVGHTVCVAVVSGRVQRQRQHSGADHCSRRPDHSLVREQMLPLPSTPTPTHTAAD